MTNLSKMKLNIFNFYTLTYHIWLSYIFDIFLSAGWESTNLVLQREGKTFKLEFSIQCSSWTEDCMRFSFSKYMILFLSSNTFMVGRHWFFENLMFYRQNFCVCIGQRRNLTPCQLYTRTVNPHLTWYVLSWPHCLKFIIYLFI